MPYEVWTTLKGEKIPVSQMKDSHLLNVIRMLTQKQAAKATPRGAKWLVVMTNEASKRGLQGFTDSCTEDDLALNSILQVTQGKDSPEIRGILLATLQHYADAKKSEDPLVKLPPDLAEQLFSKLKEQDPAAVTYDPKLGKDFGTPDLAWNEDLLRDTIVNLVKSVNFPSLTCVPAGTLLLTPTGSVPVESVSQGYDPILRSGEGAGDPVRGKLEEDLYQTRHSWSSEIESSLLEKDDPSHCEGWQCVSSL
jgi:hypothetical protein